MDLKRSFEKTTVQSGLRTLRTASSLLAAGACLLIPAASTLARGFDYGSPQRTINAGVLYTPGGALASPEYPEYPYVFYQLSISTDASPVGWNFVNPIAPHEVNQDINQRWGLTIGDAITPSNGPYWEVSLPTTSESQLQQFQVLLLEVSGDPGLAQADLEKLRQYVDGGGILWIDGATPSYSDTYKTFDQWFLPSGVSGGGAFLATTALGPSLGTGIPAMNEPYDLALGSEFDWITGLDGSYSSGAGDADMFHFFGERQTDVSDNAYIGVGHLGAGEVIYTPGGISSKIGGGSATIPNTLTPAIAYAPLLQLASDLIGQSNYSLNAQRERQPASASGDAFGTSVMPIWRFIPTTASGAATGPSEAVTYGRFSYVVNPDGTLHWFVLAPKGNQSSNEFQGNGFPVQLPTGGAPYSAATVWPGYCNVDTSAAAPYVDGGADGFVHLFLEDKAGGLHWVDTAPGSSGASGAFGTLQESGTGGGAFVGTTPSPFIYEHTLYATEPNGQLYVYDLLNGFSASSGGTYVAEPTPGTTETGMGGPVVGIVPDDCNNIVAAYSTSRGLYTVFAGARGEKLVDAGYDPSGGNHLYSTKLTGNPPVNPSQQTGQIDQAAGSYGVYTLGTNGVKSYFSNPAFDAAGQHFSIPITGVTNPGAGELFADYDVDWQKSQISSSGVAAPGALNRMQVGFASQPTMLGSGGATMLSSPVMDQSGNIYYVNNVSATDSSVICLRDAYPQSSAKLRWRYKLPTAADYSWFVTQAGISNTTTGLQDAAGKDYSLLGTGLAGSAPDPYNFVGTPVIDSHGSEYVAAIDATGQYSAIFRFDTNTPISINLNVGSNGINPSVQITQQSINANEDEYGGTPEILIGGTNFTANGGGLISFSNFGQPTSNMLYPILSEGEPANVQFTYASGQGTGSPPPNMPFNTNVAWCADLCSAGNNSGLLPSSVASPLGVICGMAVVGDYLYFTTSSGHLYRLYTQNTATTGQVANGVHTNVGYYDMRATNTAQKPVLADLGNTSLTLVPLSAGISSTGDVTASNGTVEVTGMNGVVNYQAEMTLVTDRTRLMGLDADGDAMFAVDSTDEVQQTAVSPTGLPVSTHVPLDRPTDVTQLSTDRYLLADRGNNRCVEIDRQGNILWELSKFNDFYQLLGPGEPLTLNDPTSVQIWRDDQNNVHYLIADSGNYRIVDVVDLVTNGSNSLVHYLDWVSQTGDRHYRFESAFRYVTSIANYGTNSQVTSYAIAALVTNKQIAPLLTDTSGIPTLQPSNFDAPGSSIVLLNSGFPSAVMTAFPGSTMVVQNYNTGQITNVITNFQTASGAGYTTFSAKNARFLGSYTPDPSAMTTTTTPYTNPATGYAYHDELLYCDDNGAFDLDPTWNPAWNTPTTPPTLPYATSNWWLGQTTYDGLTTPISAGLSSFSRSGIPFAPTSIERVGTDTQTSGGYTGRYLITNPYTQGYVNPLFNGPNGPGFGGEAFLISGQTNTILTDRTFSRPSNTSPLSQPTCAVIAK